MNLALRSPGESRLREWAYPAAVGLAIAVGVLRIILTYPALFQTCDEPYHVAIGIGWLDRGQVSDIDHPPLARIAIGLPLYLDGVRSPTGMDVRLMPEPSTRPDVRFAGGEEILRSRGALLRNLSLARAGVLPFFVAGCVLLWLWTKRLFGRLAALTAVVLFSSLPPVLAHAGLATTDMAVTVLLFAAVYAFVLWLEKPDPRRSLVLGVAVGLAALSKFSAFVFLPACVVALLVARWLFGRSPQAPLRSLWKRLGVVAVTALLVIWAGYRFTARPYLEPENRPHGIVRRLGLEAYLSRHDRLNRIVNEVLEVPVPAVDMIHGLARLRRYSEGGRLAYFLGEYRVTGSWYFFPVVLAVKTPLPFLLLLGAGVLFFLRSRDRGRQWEWWAPGLCAVAILAVALTSGLNIGLRHALPVYPFVCMLAAFGFDGLRKKTRLLGPAAAAMLLLWQLGESALAHPDYLAYFNQLAGARPEKIVIDSDLDWGQGIWRLRDKLNALNVTELSLGDCWTDRSDGMGLPGVRPLLPYEPVKGWVAITEFTLKTCGEKLRRKAGASSGAYDWLEPLPFVRVGRSIRLYYVR